MPGKKLSCPNPGKKVEVQGAFPPRPAAAAAAATTTPTAAAATAATTTKHPPTPLSLPAGQWGPNDALQPDRPLLHSKGRRLPKQDTSPTRFGIFADGRRSALSARL